MLNQPTLEKLQTMKLHGMADAFRTQLETADTSQLSFEERFAMLVDQQWLWKENRALARRLRAAGSFRSSAEFLDTPSSVPLRAD